MRFASASSSHVDPGVAIDEVLEALAEVPEAHLGFLFVTPDHARRLREVQSRIRSAYPGVVLVGCTGQGVIGGGEEVEGRSAVALTVGELPGVEVSAFHLAPADLPTREAELRQAVPADRACVLLSDPFSINLQPLLGAIEAARPGVALFGGQASGGRRPKEHALVLDDVVHDEGVVGLALSGRVDVRTGVAQGCRPIGAPMFVSSCQGNQIRELDGRDPVEVLRELYASLPPEDQYLFRDSLFVGVQMRDQQEYRPGDFLIRNLVGIPKEGRALVVAYEPERFSVVQLHLRDADAAREDVQAVVAAHRQQAARAAGGLLFTCVGRGEGLYGEAGHDSGVFREHFGPVPLGGFFCNGEIGPVHGQTFLHGYTSVFATFGEPPE